MYCTPPRVGYAPIPGDAPADPENSNRRYMGDGMKPDHVFEGAGLSHGYCYDPGPCVYVVAVVDLDPRLLSMIDWRLIKRADVDAHFYPCAVAARDTMVPLMASGLYAAVACVALVWDRETDGVAITDRGPDSAVVIDLGTFGPLTPEGPTTMFPGRRSLHAAVHALWPAADGEKGSV